MYTLLFILLAFKKRLIIKGSDHKLYPPLADQIIIIF